MSSRSTTPYPALGGKAELFTFRSSVNWIRYKMCKVKHQYIELERTLALLPLSVALAEGSKIATTAVVGTGGGPGTTALGLCCEVRNGVRRGLRQSKSFNLGRGGYFTFIIALAKWPRVWPNPATEHRAAVRSSTPGSLCAAGPKQRISLLAPFACSPGVLTRSHPMSFFSPTCRAQKAHVCLASFMPSTTVGFESRKRVIILRAL
eukprot:scaffold54822_cov63-Phaeocystis_antarctica.AAC.1